MLSEQFSQRVPVHDDNARHIGIMINECFGDRIDSFILIEKPALTSPALYTASNAQVWYTQTSTCNITWLCELVTWLCQLVMWLCQLTKWLCQLVTWLCQLVTWSYQLATGYASSSCCYANSPRGYANSSRGYANPLRCYANSPRGYTNSPRVRVGLAMPGDASQTPLTLMLFQTSYREVTPQTITGVV